MGPEYSLGYSGPITLFPQATALTLPLPPLPLPLPLPHLRRGGGAISLRVKEQAGPHKLAIGVRDEVAANGSFVLAYFTVGKR